MTEHRESSALIIPDGVGENGEGGRIIELRPHVAPVRSSMLRLLDGGKSDACKGCQKAELIKKLELKKQYAYFGESGFFDEDELNMEGCPGLPDFRDVAGAFTNEELARSAGYVQPELVLMRGDSLEEKIGRIDSRLTDNVIKYSGHYIVYHTDLDVSYSDSGVRSEEPHLWRAAIAEGMPEMGIFKWDNPANMYLGDRIANAEINCEPCENFVDPQIYAMLARKAAMQGWRLDQKTYTFFPRYNPGSELGRVFCARWGYKAPRFYRDAKMHKDPLACIRPYVGGRSVRHSNRGLHNL